MLMMAHRRLMHEDPIVFALRDKVSLLTGILTLLLLAVASLVAPPPGHTPREPARPGSERLIHGDLPERADIDLLLLRGGAGTSCPRG